MAFAEDSAVEMTVTVITRNRGPILEHCLRGLANQSLDPSRYEIVVVDDGSTDETTAVIAAAQQRARCQIRAFRYSEHRGLSVVRNRSVREARGAVIVFVDSDGLVAPSFLSVHLAAHHATHEPIVCRGPIIAVESLDRPFTARWSLLDLNTSFFDTSNASVRRERLFAAGLFDEGLADWEGLEMGLRLRQLGLRRVYRANAPLYHYQPAATAGSLDGALHIQEARARSAKRFFDRHPTMEVRLITSQTIMHRWLNVVQRGFGVVHADNLPAWVERCRRWGVPALSRVLTGAVVTGRYLSHLQQLTNTGPASDALGPRGATPPARRRS
jgi:glycosyltransferase involved in cell wall biosynthesis